MQNPKKAFPQRLIFALLVPFLALILQLQLWPWVSPLLWFLFYPAVFIAGGLGGLWGGIISTCTSIVLVNWFFIEPVHRFSADNFKHLLQMGLFALIGFSIAIARHFHDQLLHKKYYADQKTKFYLITDPSDWPS